MLQEMFHNCMVPSEPVLEAPEGCLCGTRSVFRRCHPHLFMCPSRRVWPYVTGWLQRVAVPRCCFKMWWGDNGPGFGVSRSLSQLTRRSDARLLMKHARASLTEALLRGRLRLRAAGGRAAHLNTLGTNLLLIRQPLQAQLCISLLADTLVQAHLCHLQLLFDGGKTILLVLQRLTGILLLHLLCCLL